MMHVFTEATLPRMYTQVATRNPVLQHILEHHGQPPLWVRPNSFATLVLTILEQQVSLASAYAAFQRLKNKLPQIEPELFLQLTDDELRACSFTRQKITYTHGLATAMVSGEINLHTFEQMDDDAVRRQLKTLKGIGDWTVDIYLLHALQRTDVFPLGDLALIKAMQALLPPDASGSKEAMLHTAEAWRPYRSLATMLLWHWYIKTKNIKLLH